MKISEELKEKLIVLLGDEVTEALVVNSIMIGKICMIRTYAAGVHFGKLVFKKDQCVVLNDSYRVHYWKSACSLSQLAMEGETNMSESRIAMKVNEIELSQVIEIIPMTQKSVKSLTSSVWKK